MGKGLADHFFQAQLLHQETSHIRAYRHQRSAFVVDFEQQLKDAGAPSGAQKEAAKQAADSTANELRGKVSDLGRDRGVDRCKDGCVTGGPGGNSGSRRGLDNMAAGPDPPTAPPAQVPKEWLEADAAKRADDKAAELVQKEVQRCALDSGGSSGGERGKSFEDVANQDIDDPAEDENALKPRPVYDPSPEGESKKYPPPGSTDRWGGPAMQRPEIVQWNTGVSLSGSGSYSYLLAALLSSVQGSGLVQTQLRVRTSFVKDEYDVNAQDDDDDGSLDHKQDAFQDDIPEPGAKDEFGGPAMQQPSTDPDGPSKEGSMDRMLVGLASLCPSVCRRQRLKDFL
mmetsp:Transcript_54686/g.97568  ORF Transcript_54686/g.97568 Transcript_54686/m.97568 type:complete len:341 (-) Transcript_54686:43-1065(-)